MTANLNSDKQKFEEEMKRLGNSEECVMEVLCKRTAYDSWEIKDRHPGNDPGIDLKVQKDNRIIIIEAKGERPSPGQYKNEVWGALEEIVKDMKDENPEIEYRYCCAFPDTKTFQRAVHLYIPRKLCQERKINIVFVNCESGLLKVLQHDTSTVIDLNNFDELFR